MDSPVVQEWLSNPTLVNRAAHGRLALSVRDFLSRGDVLTNDEVLIPILKYMGTRPSVEAIHQHVELFFTLARPKGKPSMKCFLFAAAS